MKKDNSCIVLIPHYNNFNGLIKSISSIEKGEKIDILIVDDGSTKNIIKEELIINSFKGAGIVFFKYIPNNKGIAETLNIGLSFIIKNKYKYTARLDCGDICINKRFFKQQTFLENNPDIKLIGANVIFNDTDGNELYKLKLPQTHEIIKKKMYFNAMIIHPTFMFNTIILNEIGYYQTNYKAAEDYAFLFKVIQRFKVANLNQYLVVCEISKTGISIVHRKEQVKNRIKIILKYFYFGYYPIIGLLRSLFLYIFPVRLLLFIKNIIK